MDLGDERAGRVDGPEVAGFGLIADGGGDAVGGEDDDAARRDFVEAVNEHHALIDKAVHDVAIVDNLMINEQRLIGEDVEDLVHDINRHAYTRTEPSWIGQNDLH